MQITQELIFNVGLLFIMMLPGVVMKKCGLCSADFGKGLSNLVLYIAQPALIVFAYLDFEGEGIWLNSLIVFLLSVLAHVIFAVCALLLFRGAPEARQKMLRFATIFSNAAFMGIPLISAILGDEATIYASIYNVTFNIFLWTLGVYLCAQREKEDGTKRSLSEIIPLKKLIFHPVMIASFLGIAFLAIGINSYVPDIIMSSFSMLKGLVAPLSMVVLGLRISDIHAREHIKDKNMYIFLALRHFLLPALVIFSIWGLKAIGLPISEIAEIVVVILAATPAATSSTMFAEKFDCDAAYVSALVTVSTLLSVASMPLMVYMLSLV